LRPLRSSPSQVDATGRSGLYLTCPSATTPVQATILSSAPACVPARGRALEAKKPSFAFPYRCAAATVGPAGNTNPDAAKGRQGVATAPCGAACALCCDHCRERQLHRNLRPGWQRPASESRGASEFRLPATLLAGKSG
jgi:hypothetical protein